MKSRLCDPREQVQDLIYLTADVGLLVFKAEKYLNLIRQTNFA